MKFTPRRPSGQEFVSKRQITRLATRQHRLVSPALDRYKASPSSASAKRLCKAGDKAARLEHRVCRIPRQSFVSASPRPRARASSPRRTHRQQHRQGNDDEAEADPRRVHDALCSVLNSGRFAHHITLRLPKVAPKVAIYRPEARQHQAQAVAEALRKQGIAALVCVPFAPIAAPVDHLHIIASREPSNDWIARYRSIHGGPKAYHAREVSGHSIDRTRLARYVARQTVFALVAAPSLSPRPITSPEVLGTHGAGCVVGLLPQPLKDDAPCAPRPKLVPVPTSRGPPQPEANRPRARPKCPTSFALPIVRHGGQTQFTNKQDDLNRR